MKIVIVTYNSGGGIVQYVAQLANALSETEQVVVIGPEAIDRAQFSKRVKVLELPLANTKKKFLLSVVSPFKFNYLARAIRKENPDVVHFQERYLSSALILFLIQRYPIVTTLHDPESHYGAQRFDHWISKELHCRFSDCIIVHGEKIKNRVMRQQSCYVVPIGDYSFLLKYKQINVHKEKKTMLFFGRISEYKGLEYLLEATIEVQMTDPNIKLIIAGEGGLGKYETLLKRVNNVEIHNNYIPDEDVAALFQRATIVVLPYIDASQSAVVPIAFTFKKAVVATNVGSIPEVVQHNKTGLIVPPRDSKRLAEAIIRLVKDERARITLGENAYQLMTSRLAWTEIARSTKLVYEEAIRKKNAN